MCITAEHLVQPQRKKAWQGGGLQSDDLNNMADHERINKLNNTSWIEFMYVSGSVDVCIMFNKPLTKRSIILYQTRTKITRSTT